jgi:hypothetical protein
MSRFSLFALRLVLAILAIVGTLIASAVRLWGGMPPADVAKGLVLGLAFAWAIGPSSDDLQAFRGLMTADD